jgi:hypothetical protein
MIDISKVFGTSSEPVSGFFLKPGIGYYIPLYQREYSWDQENIDQLMEDICHGVETLVSDDEAIRFMGTIILVTEHNVAENIQPQDSRALPSRIDNVIDGQQRISTIALLASLLYQTLARYRNNLPKEGVFDSLREQIDDLNETLIELFSFDLKRGTPRRKPVIIRGSIDAWTLDKNESSNYISDVSSYLASVIRSINDDSSFPAIPSGTLVGQNLKRMTKWLNDVEHAWDPSKDTFPSAWEILANIDQKHIWSYSRPELVSIVNDRNDPMTKTEKRVCSLVQLFAFSHFLLHRCCFTLIEPTSENWAFDMFQSLNASGTPLTAVETFKPLVVNTVNSLSDSFKGSNSETYFKAVDNLLGSQRSAAQKTKLTKEYLTTFALTHDGSKLSSQFSTQRKWLTDKYGKSEKLLEKEDFVRNMYHLANYWNRVIWYDPSSSSVINGIESADDNEKKLASLCVSYIKDSGHDMAHTILSRFYSLIERGKQNSIPDFISACKALAAFFTIWRSAYSNTGLDDTYRQLLKETFSWKQGNCNIDAATLKKELVRELTKKGVWNKAEWKNRASQNLRYDSAKMVCKFTLFVVAHDTIIDPDFPGLMKVGTDGSYPYLDPVKWSSPDFRTIEHIAPRKAVQESDWDKSLYENDEFEKVGNLTLLPIEINASAGNKCWLEKLIYYKHLAENDPDNLAKLEKEAFDNGITLSSDTIGLLIKTSHKHHIRPIVELGSQRPWDREIVDQRSDRICDILWDRISCWLI